MKFSLSWLKDHIDTAASVEEIARTLNAIGLEVEGVEDPAEKLAGFRIAKVLTAERHPNADKLQVLTVDAGTDINDGQPLQVVCGAPNARAGLVGVLGLPGALVPANGMELKVAAVRGVESNGMMCSSRELELGEDHQGIIELPADAPVGTAFAEYSGSDPVFDVAVTPNRPDCMGINGIARDLIAAKLGMPPKSPKRSTLTVYTYKGSPRMMQRKTTQMYRIALRNQGLLVPKNLLTLFFIVSVEETEVLIEGFVAVEDIEIILGYNKVIEI